MLPLNQLSSELIKGKFKFPSNLAVNELEDYELGGIALSNPSKGLEFQAWHGYWNPEDATVYLKPIDAVDYIPLFSEADVIEFSFAFDQNMRWVTVTRFEDNTAKLRWYNAEIAGYSISVFSDIQSVKLTLDDKRELQIQSGASDVIFSYMSEGNLCWRQQRDRYEIEYVHEVDLPHSMRITNLGMTDKLRLQWRLAARTKFPGG